MPDIGKIAPDFELKNQDNELVRLSDCRGKRVIIFAFPQSQYHGLQ